MPSYTHAALKLRDDVPSLKNGVLINRTKDELLSDDFNVGNLTSKVANQQYLQWSRHYLRGLIAKYGKEIPELQEKLTLANAKIEQLTSELESVRAQSEARFELAEMSTFEDDGLRCRLTQEKAREIMFQIPFPTTAVRLLAVRVFHTH